MIACRNIFSRPSNLFLNLCHTCLLQILREVIINRYTVPLIFISLYYNISWFKTWDGVGTGFKIGKSPLVRCQHPWASATVVGNVLSFHFCIVADLCVWWWNTASWCIKISFLVKVNESCECSLLAFNRPREINGWLDTSVSQRQWVQFLTVSPVSGAGLCGFGKLHSPGVAPEEGNDQPVLSIIYLENPGKDPHE